jgi:hypothetical protein
MNCSDTHAFKVTVGNEPLFATVKADKRAHPGDGSQRRGDATTSDSASLVASGRAFPGLLPGLWIGESIAVTDAVAYFDGRRTVMV